MARRGCRPAEFRARCPRRRVPRADAVVAGPRWASHMEHILQIVGRRCSRCSKTISSVAEGAFCSLCYNPVHNKCRPTEGEPVPEGCCSVCGADPLGENALKTKAEVEGELATKRPQLVCPKCRSSHGFSPYGRKDEVESRDAELVLVLNFTVFALMAFFELIFGLGRLANRGVYECLNCGHVFRPASRFSVLGCGIILFLVITISLVVAMVWVPFK